ncbi:phosphatase PAP2 family protein [Nocardiopsis ansamitocini]|uniref:Phosphatidic acid phosphatase type 2/haloperoxidase domain-containing protein n=1 Tax=Nocardiopsis ansamitocini TaxID=1670832 RepID=A0A9W6UG96_9ACTN|nr:phosphatase PAP2 family protein [Nocardiopsis ansamitocini]GLU46936.1 hypothetical protein Nans01_12870 [Nocardiopsis ansamitocini]
MATTQKADADTARTGPLRLAGWLFVVTVALALLTWQVVVQGPVTALDWPLHVHLDARQPEGWLMELAVLVARLGQRAVTVPLLLGAALWATWHQRGPRPLLATLTGLASLAVMGTLLKVAVGRTPPVVGVDVVSPGLGNVVDWAVSFVSLGAVAFDGYVSFPSGHSANAALTYPLLALLLFGPCGARPDPRKARIAVWWAIVPVAAVGAMMTVLDYHWATESIGGWLLGAGVLLVALLVLGERPHRARAACPDLEVSGPGATG